MNTNQKIAHTFLTSRLRQLLVAVLSVTFGISMYVFMNSFMQGVNAIQTEITFTSMSHIRIFNDLDAEVKSIQPLAQRKDAIRVISSERNIQYTEGIKDAAGIQSALRDLDEIAAMTAQLNQNVFIKNGVTQSSANLTGIETENDNALFRTKDYIIEGDLDELNRRSYSLVLGSGLARSLGVSTGDNVLVITSSGLQKPFKVVGLSETGALGNDRGRALTSIQTARQLFSKNQSYATEILINVDDFNRAQEVANKVRKYTDFKVEAWQDGNDQLAQANVLRDIIAIAVSLTILIVAGFGIYNIMNMTVNEKIKEIAILKAMGFRGGDVVEIFLTQSVIIGLMGGCVGLLLGHIIVRVVDVLPFKIATLDTLPVVYRPIDYILAFVFGVIVTFLAGYLPARKASRVDPVDILRG